MMMKWGLSQIWASALCGLSRLPFCLPSARSHPLSPQVIIAEYLKYDQMSFLGIGGTLIPKYTNLIDLKTNWQFSNCFPWQLQPVTEWEDLWRFTWYRGRDGKSLLLVIFALYVKVNIVDVVIIYLYCLHCSYCLHCLHCSNSFGSKRLLCKNGSEVYLYAWVTYQNGWIL